MRKKALVTDDLLEHLAVIEACKDMEDWEHGARLMACTSDPLMKEKIARILSGESVDH
jgi:hypothetical protein